eukprot:524544_1
MIVFIMMHNVEKVFIIRTRENEFVMAVKFGWGDCDCKLKPFYRSIKKDINSIEATDIGFGRFNSYLIVLSSISASSGLASSKSIFHQKNQIVHYQYHQLEILSVGKYK